MINNFEKIKPLLSFNSEDEFYFVQIIQRKKDNPEIKGRNNNNRLIKPYNIKSIEHLETLQDEMIEIADIFNARIGINLNKRSFEKTAFNTLKKMADCMHNKDFRNVRNAWNHACDIHNSVDDKFWILDIDNPQEGEDAYEEQLVWYVDHNTKLQDKEKIVCKLPSKSGYHLITRPFDVQNFQIKYPEVEIHRNNPTNLYIP